MLTEIMHSNSVLKLRGILQSRYGVGLRVTSMVDASIIDFAKQGSIKKNGSLLVPIIARDKYLGTAVMDRAEQLSDSDVNAISEIVRLVLEPALFSYYLTQEAHNIEQSSGFSSSNELTVTHLTDLTNVTHLNASPTQSRFESEQYLSTEGERKKELSVSVLYLKCTNPHRISRIAIHIHELGTRWALLHWKDIKNEIKDVSDLKSMGPMTILVDDIFELSPDEQKLIEKYSQESNVMTEPFILIGGTSRIAEMMDQKSVLEELGIYLMKNYLELDRLPTDFNVLKEALELLLDRKALLN